MEEHGMAEPQHTFGIALVAATRRVLQVTSCLASSCLLDDHDNVVNDPNPFFREVYLDETLHVFRDACSVGSRGTSSLLRIELRARSKVPRGTPFFAP